MLHFVMKWQCFIHVIFLNYHPFSGGSISQCITPQAETIPLDHDTRANASVLIINAEVVGFTHSF
jgi:hypothetical protein